MANEYNEELLANYQREMGYLRRMGSAFAETYPKVASRLEIGGAESPDPHVERLLESFALLTARIQQNIDAEFPQIPQALLGILYPQFVDPVPSMSIARFDVDPALGKLTTGYTIPRYEQVFANTRGGTTCRFRTCYPVTLWPVEVTPAAFEATDQYDFLDGEPHVATLLKLTIETKADPLHDLEIGSLRFYLDADRVLSDVLYELLFCHVHDIALLPDGRKDRPIRIGADAIQPVGFNRDEAVLPYPAFAQPGYRLLQEYFTFPEKYLFFDLEKLAGHGAEKSFDVLIMLDETPRTKLPIDHENFALGATPIVNLFKKSTEPIRITQRQTEYRLVADHRRERTTEIHSLQAMTGTNIADAEAYSVEPFFSFNHQAQDREARCFWYARREPTARADLPGTDLYVSFLDLGFNPSQPAVTTLYGHTLCTNRDLPEQLQAGTLLHYEEGAPVSRIVCLTKPTRQINPPLGGETLWRLISHLSLNYLSLSEYDGSLQALREVLRLYSSFAGNASVEQQINGLRRLDTRRVVRRVGADAWRGFARGTEVELELDERAFVGSSAYLLGSVLQHFFGLYASVNSFAQLTLKSTQRDEVWKRWPPRAGEQAIL
jgi:type VI secretion system protein ImpG